MRKIQILGTGCAKCKKLAEETDAAAKAAGLAYELEKVTDIQEIMEFGVMSMPAVAVDGRVKVSGRIPSRDELENLLKE